MRLSDREAETSESKVCTADLAHRRLFCKSPRSGKMMLRSSPSQDSLG